MEKVLTDFDSFGFDCLLFESCNLHCKFCLEAHNSSKIDYEYIKRIPTDIFKAFEDVSNNYPPIKSFNFRLWGGELFYDSLPDELFDLYRQIIKEIYDLFHNKYPEAYLEFAWVTNGVWNNRDRVEKLILDTDSILGFSYDPVDRYNSEDQKQLAIDNILYFQDKGRLNEVSTVLTTHNIKAYIENRSDLELFRKAKTIDINYYVPNPNWEELMPTDDDLFNFFKWAIDNRFYNIFDIRNIFNSLINNVIYRSCNCHRHISHCKNSTTFNCVKSSSIFPNNRFYGNIEITEQNVASIKRKLGINKRGCLYCDKNNICPQPCWTSILFDMYKTTYCPFQRIYNYITPEMIEDYKRYINETRN